MADLCVTWASTTQMTALFEGCPVMTLGNGILMGRDIAYEVHSREQLDSVLSNALRRDSWPERRSRGQALIAAMFERDLFGLSDAVPTRLQLRDLAQLVGRFAHYKPAGTASATDRLLSFRMLLEGLADREGDGQRICASVIDRLRDEIETLSADSRASLLRDGQHEHKLRAMQIAMTERDAELEAVMAGLKAKSELLESCTEDVARGSATQEELRVACGVATRSTADLSTRLDTAQADLAGLRLSLEAIRAEVAQKGKEYEDAQLLTRTFELRVTVLDDELSTGTARKVALEAQLSQMSQRAERAEEGWAAIRQRPLIRWARKAGLLPE